MINAEPLELILSFLLSSLLSLNAKIIPCLGDIPGFNLFLDLSYKRFAVISCPSIIGNALGHQTGSPVKLLIDEPSIFPYSYVHRTQLFAFHHAP